MLDIVIYLCQKLQEMNEKEKAVLQEAGDRSRGIVAQAEGTAKVSAEKIIEEAKEQSGKILKNAEREIEENRKKMIQEVRQELGELVSMVSEKVARVSLDKKQHQELIDRAIDDLEKEEITA
jgi:F-type H+-transporting ATPase subunit b